MISGRVPETRSMLFIEFSETEGRTAMAVKASGIDGSHDQPCVRRVWPGDALHRATPGHVAPAGC